MFQGHNAEFERESRLASDQELAKVLERLSETNVQLVQARESSATHQETSKALQVQIDTLEAQAQVSSERESLQSELNRVSEAHAMAAEALNRENELLSAKLDKVEPWTVELEQKLATTQEFLKEAEQQKNVLEVRVQKLQRSSRLSLEQSQALVQDTVEELKTIQAAKDELQMLMNSQANDFRAKIATHESEIASLNHSNQFTTSALQAEKFSSSQLTARTQQLENELQQVQFELNQKQKHLSISQDNLKENQVKISGLEMVHLSLSLSLSLSVSSSLSFLIVISLLLTHMLA